MSAKLHPQMVTNFEFRYVEIKQAILLYFSLLIHGLGKRPCAGA